MKKGGIQKMCCFIVLLLILLICTAAKYIPVIYQAQKQLSLLGYNPRPLYGCLGKRTEKAINEFQKDRGLRATGRLDEQIKREIHDHSTMIVKRQMLLNMNLIEAAKCGDVNTLKSLLDGGADINATDQGYTALMNASWKGHRQIIKVLLSRGADVNTINTRTGETALILAVKGGYLFIVESLLNSGADTNVETYQGWTALNIAAYRCNVSIVKALLEFGANPHQKNNMGRTPFFYAKLGRHGMNCLVTYQLLRGDFINNRKKIYDQRDLEIPISKTIAEQKLKSSCPKGADLISIISETILHFSNGSLTVPSWTFTYKDKENPSRFISIKITIDSKTEKGYLTSIKELDDDENQFFKNKHVLSSWRIDRFQAEDKAKEVGGFPMAGFFHLHMGNVEEQFVPIWILPYAYPDYLHRAIRADNGRIAYLVIGDIRDRKWLINPKWTMEKPEPIKMK